MKKTTKLDEGEPTDGKGYDISVKNKKNSER